MIDYKAFIVIMMWFGVGFALATMIYRDGFLKGFRLWLREKMR